MQCTQCNLHEATRGTLCETCVEANRKRMMQQSAMTAQLSRGARQERERWHKKLSPRSLEVVLVVLVFIFFFRESLWPFPRALRRVELTPVAGAEPDPCADKKRCFVVVVAPWCPACHATLGFLRVMRSYAARRGDLGVQIVVAQDNIAQLQQMASEIGGPVYLDSHRNMRGGAVPRWWVIDDKRNVVVRGKGLPGIADEGAEFKRYLKEYLKLQIPL